MRLSVLSEQLLDPRRDRHAPPAFAPLQSNYGRAAPWSRNGSVVWAASSVPRQFEDIVDVIAVEADMLVRRATYTVPAAGCAWDVGVDGRIAIARQDASDAPDVPIQIAVGEPEGTWSEIRVPLAGGAVRAVRWTEEGKLLVLSENEESELLLVDSRTGASVARATVGAAMCDDGWLPDVVAGHVLVHGHCACQEHELELVRFDGERLESRDWRVHAPEGLCALGIIDGEVFTIENDPRGFARRRELATGRVIAERDVSGSIGGFAVAPVSQLGGHIAFAAFRYSSGAIDSLALLDRRTLEVVAMTEIPDKLAPVAFIDSRRLVVAGAERVVLLAIDR